MFLRRENGVRIATIASMVFVLGLCGCSADGKSVSDSNEELSSAAVATLVKADAADGKTDKLVSKCLTCGLGMAGKAEHSTRVGAYELHLCSDHCKEMVVADPEKALASLGN